MVVFPNCKINLGLRILRKRPDGYHDLDTVFYPLRLKDILEILPSKAATPQCHLSGIPVSGDPSSNLCIKAWHLLKKEYPQLPVIDCWLHKIIPIGAGLGGGSADGAFMLTLLNQYFQLGIDKDHLITYALALGSDCPFFIENRPCHAMSRGEILSPIDLNLEGYYFALVHPGIHIPTGWAFQQITPTEKDSNDLLSILQLPPANWKGHLVNDFEKPIADAHPEIASIIASLYASGALYAAMSGSGSAVFGLFKEPVALRDRFPGHYFIREAIPASLAG